MEYLYSKSNRGVEEDFADPDTPDGLQDEDQEGDLEGDEGFEDLSFDVPVEFMELTCNPLLPIHQKTAALQPPGLSSSEIGPAESSLPETATQSQVNKYPLSINNEVLILENDMTVII